jgi:septal ring factor EnvC (AmiA/AmiB activator)
MAQDPPARLATEQELSIVEEKIKLLHEQIEEVENLLSNLVSKVDKQAEQVNKLTSQLSIAQSEDRRLNTEITRCQHAIGQLSIDLKRLSRYIQYEFAGVDDSIIWELCLDKPVLKSRIKLKKPR